MTPDLHVMHNVWDGLKIGDRRPTSLPQVNFNEIVSSIFAAGPFYYYSIDFFDNLSISNMSSGFMEAHGVRPERIKTVNDILSLTHPDDMEFVAKAEEKAARFIYDVLGAEKFLTVKISYNFRFRTADGSYQLFNHQSLFLTMDENNNFGKSLNIHTNISHITNKNSHKLSLIGLGGEPSYLNLDVFESLPGTSGASASAHRFTKREVEIIKLLAGGCGTKGVAEKLSISPGTVETHRKNILKKSGCKNSAELVAMSLSEGWI